MQKNKIFLSVFLSLLMLTSASQAFADFNPNKLIEDKSFSDAQAFTGAAGIQEFLQSKNSVLANTSPDFLQKLGEPADASLKINLNDPEPNLGRLRTAAELIWDASVKTGLNPQVILVTLEKEQSLITGTFPDPNSLQSALNVAMGFGCPDSGGCDNIFHGFYFQLFGNFDSQGNRYIGAPDSLMRSFNTPGGRGPQVDAQNETFGSPTVRTSHVGDTIIIDNTQGGPQNPPPTEAVTLGNSATAALYRYTPHVYNGNYNFWKLYDQWFRYPNGTLLNQGNGQIYIVDNGLVSLVPNFVLAARGLNAATAVAISPTELSTYDQGPTYGPADNTIIKIAGDANNVLYVFEQNQRHPASTFVLQQRGLNPAAALVISKQEAGMFPAADQLTPKEGTLVQPQGTQTVYIIENQKKYALTAFTFKQYGFSFKDVLTALPSEVAQYPDGGFLLPKDGTLVKAAQTPTVYVLQAGQLHPITGPVFGLYKYSFKNIVVLDQGELANAPVGNFLTPPSGTIFYTKGTQNYYMYLSGTKHPMSAFVQKQYNAGKVAIQLGETEAPAIPDGLPQPPKDGTLIKGDASATIYAMVSGQKQPLDYHTWVVKYHKAAPNVLPEAEVASY